MIDIIKNQIYNNLFAISKKCLIDDSNPNKIIETDTELKDWIAKFAFVQPQTALKYLEQFETLIYFTNNEIFHDPQTRFTNLHQELSCLIKTLYLFLRNTVSVDDNNASEKSCAFTTTVHYLEIDSKKEKTLQLKIDTLNMSFSKTTISAHLPYFKWHIPHFFIPAFVSCLLTTVDKSVIDCHSFFKELENKYSSIIKNFYNTEETFDKIKTEFSTWLDTFLARQYFLSIEQAVETFASTPENQSILRNYFYPLHQYLLYNPEPFSVRLKNAQSVLDAFTECINNHFSSDKQQRKIPLIYLYPNKQAWPLNGEKEFLDSYIINLHQYISEFISYIENYNKEHQKPNCPFKLALNDFDSFNKEYSKRLDNLKLYQNNFNNHLDRFFYEAISYPDVKSALEKGYLETVDIPKRIKFFSVPITNKFLQSVIKELQKFLDNTERATFPTSTNTQKLYITENYLENLKREIAKSIDTLGTNMKQWPKQPPFFTYHDLGILKKLPQGLMYDGLAELNERIKEYENMLYPHHK